MNYYAPREIIGSDGKGSGRWHYTCHNKRIGTFAVGHCSPTELCPACGHRAWPPDFEPMKCDICGGTGIVQKANPCPGHSTPEEAAEHYRQYLLDHATYDLACVPTEQHRCQAEGCFRWTQKAADVRHTGGMFFLCDEHRNRETLEKLLPPIWQIASSY